MNQDHNELDEPQKVLHIAVFSEFLEGFYQGEIANHIRQLCALKRYRFTAIRTASINKYSVPLGLEHYDGVIVIRNAISKELVERIITAKIPLVSVGYEYQRFNVPYVGSDNEAGMRLGLEHLMGVSKGPIGFVGKLAEFDHNARLDYFKLVLEDNNHPFDEACIFDSPQSSFIGGQRAAQQFMAQGKTCKAVLCASGLIGLGFFDYLKNSGVNIPEDVAVVSFDPISITPLVARNIVAIDQNLHLISCKSVNLIENLVANKPVVHHHWVQPKLLLPSEDLDRQLKSYLRTSTESIVSENTNYMKCVSANCFEWTRNICESSLDEIMSLSLIFKRYMNFASFSKFSSSNEVDLVLRNSYTRCGALGVDCGVNRARAEQYPEPFLANEYLVATHFPIELFGRNWGLLSFYGIREDNEEVSSYLSFSSFVDIVCFNLKTALECQVMSLTNNGEHDVDEAINLVVESFANQWSDGKG